MPGTRQADILNDLIRINIDRIAGYERAVQELKDKEDADLNTLFQAMIQESREYVEQLTKELLVLGEKIKEDSAGFGKIYAAWMEIKAFFTGDERQTILNSCEAIEDATKKAYQSALEEAGIHPQAYAVIENQNAALLQAHDRIKKLRDA